jgi:hypothetical protein
MGEITAWDVLKIALPILIALIGVIYGVLRSGIKENKDEIKRVDKETDDRIDEVEKDIVEIKTKIEK